MLLTQVALEIPEPDAFQAVQNDAPDAAEGAVFLVREDGPEVGGEVAPLDLARARELQFPHDVLDQDVGGGVADGRVAQRDRAARVSRNLARVANVVAVPAQSAGQEGNALCDLLHQANFSSGCLINQENN